MDLLIPAAAAGLAMASASHAASIALAMQRVARGRLRPSPLASAGVSILRPVCGIEYRIEATLVSSFQIDHPSYEVIFCVAAADDPVVPIVRRLIREHPEVPATLLVGDEGGGPNPKLANLVKAWDVATHDWIVLADSNVLMPPDYLDRLFARWTERVAFVCSPPVGIDVHGSAAELEAAFLNTFQARWQLAVEELGFGFVHGKTMLLRRSDLAGEGGLAALAREVAEDAAATKIARRWGRKVGAVDKPFPQPLGRRGLSLPSRLLSRDRWRFAVGGCWRADARLVRSGGGAGPRVRLALAGLLAAFLGRARPPATRPLGPYLGSQGLPMAWHSRRPAPGETSLAHGFVSAVDSFGRLVTGSTSRVGAAVPPSSPIAAARAAPAQRPDRGDRSGSPQ
jgi:hypothetical protein